MAAPHLLHVHVFNWEGAKNSLCERRRSMERYLDTICGLAGGQDHGLLDFRPTTRSRRCLTIRILNRCSTRTHRQQSKRRRSAPLRRNISGGNKMTTDKLEKEIADELQVPRSKTSSIAFSCENKRDKCYARKLACRPSDGGRLCARGQLADRNHCSALSALCARRRR